MKPPDIRRFKMPWESGGILPPGESVNDRRMPYANVQAKGRFAVRTEGEASRRSLTAKMATAPAEDIRDKLRI